MYCNSLCYGLAERGINKLQRVQFTLARVVTGARPLAHAPPLLRPLHWLPIRFRIIFKVQLLTFTTLHLEQPSYLYDILVNATPSRLLRSNQELSVHVPLFFGIIPPCHYAHCILLSPSERIWRHTFLTFPHNLSGHPVACWRIGNGYDFGIWNNGLTKRPWAWLCRGDWRYRSKLT